MTHMLCLINRRKMERDQNWKSFKEVKTLGREKSRILGIWRWDLTSGYGNSYHINIELDV